MTSSTPDRLETAIRGVASDIADHINAPISLKIWTGERLPLGTDAPPKPALVINEPGAIGALLRRPTLDRFLRLYAHGKIGFEGGTLIDLAEAFGTTDTRKRIKKLPKAKLVRRLLPFLFARSPNLNVSRRFSGDETGDDRRQARDSDYIRFHYDLSNDFYKLFLDEAMVYSCAHFTEWHDDLDRAQFDKLDITCRKLRLGEGERFFGHRLRLGRTRNPCSEALRRKGARCHAVRGTVQLCP